MFFINLKTGFHLTIPQQIATLNAQDAIQMFKKKTVATLGIIENMSLHYCSS